MKKNLILFKLLDLLIVFASWQFSYVFRFKTGVLRSAENLDHFYWGSGIILVLLNYYFLRREDVYGKKRYGSFSKEILATLKANSLSLLAFILIVFFVSSQRLSRITLLIYLVTSIVLFILSKYLIRKASKKEPSRKVFLIGVNAISKKYEENLKKYKELNLEIAKNSEDPTIKEILESKPDVIVVSKDLSSEFLKELTLTSIEVICLLDVNFSTIGFDIANYQGIPALVFNEVDENRAGFIAKRLMDVVLVSLGLIVLSPMFLIISLLVKLSSKGPVFYGQVRMGLDGKEFKMWKFRSMRTDSSNHQGWTVKDDPRVTKIGKFLRKTSLDEFPQLWNVLIGEMSLVGPRPERPQYVRDFSQNIKTYMLRHKMKAGITGWAQINGWRGDTSIEKRIECDLYYIKNWSIWLDCSIIFLTFFKGFFNKNAY